MAQEFLWLSNLSMSIWERLGCLSGQPAVVVWHGCLVGAGIAHAYVDKKSLALLREYPWKLCHSPQDAVIRQSLKELVVADPSAISDTVTLKIRSLLEHQYPVAEIVEGLQLLRQCRFSTISAEQGHGSAAQVHKYHRQYAVNTLVVRAFMHMVRPFLPPRLAHGDQEEGPAKVGTSKRQRRGQQTQRITGRHMFVGAALAATKDIEEAQHAHALRKTLLRQHASLWQAVDSPTRRHFEAEAAKARQRQTESFDQQQSGSLLSGASTHPTQEVTSFKGRGHWTYDFFTAIVDAANTDEYSRRKVDSLRKQALEPPRTLPSSIALQLASVTLPDEQKHHAPDWMIPLILSREQVRNVTLCLWDGPGLFRGFFYFLFATKSPRRAAFLPCVDALADGVALTSDQVAWLGTWKCQFLCRFGNVVHEHEMHLPSDGFVMVIPDTIFVGGACLASEASPVPWTDFVNACTEPVAAPKHKRADGLTSANEQQVEAEIMYLQGCVEALGDPVPEASRSAGEPARHSRRLVAEVELEEDEALAIWTELAAKRADWEVNLADAPEVFRTSVRGGQWTKVNTGSVADSIRGMASGQAAVSWCVRFGLPSTKTFAYKKYTEGLANELALFWCRRMQHFYSSWLDADERDDFCTPVIEGTAPTPDTHCPGVLVTDATHPARQSLQEIEALVPCAPEV